MGYILKQMAVITLGGNVGAGKSHVAKKLAAVLGYGELHMGDFFREMAAEAGLTIDEFYSRLKNNPDLERSVDKRQEEFLKKNDNVVVQGRVAWHFARSSPFPVINVFLAVAPAAVAVRIGERPEYMGLEHKEVMRLAAAREDEERMRYKMLYGIEDHLDPRHYNVLVDTTNLAPDEVVASILEQGRPLIEKV